ncbi:heavy-metal-associated domain-containing protein [Arthrobacter echini]|uniref:heavy-metal-associated domain-containing protein n=1 Tax=Arthrobacter echini TaxID=1529066 RepID=UPI001455EFE6|nr:heavy metal-associated domain-containing protein [Arthrobacter echini]
MFADYSVTGLTCGSCAGRVSSAIGELDGVENVRIAVVPGGISTVSVTSGRPLEASSVQDAVEKAGYQLATA